MKIEPIYVKKIQKFGKVYGIILPKKWLNLFKWKKDTEVILTIDVFEKNIKINSNEKVSNIVSV